MGADFAQRPHAAGKFLAAGDQKLWVKGVTYGPFRPDADGVDYPAPEVVRSDFAAMSGSGINAVRLYTVPPRWLLDEALACGLRVMVGLPWEQHVAFLEKPARAADIEKRVRAAARRCAGHPALLCFAVGNEIPPAIVRWHGRRRIEGFIRRLYDAVKEEDPGALVTYVNFPTTEYLETPFLDLLCFNVYLEARERFEAYLARLQNLAGERPLLMAEIGLDSRRNGLAAQAASLDWQVRSAFAAGCAGAFAFAWTDEWHRGGFDIADWDFGLTARDRAPKPALAALRAAYSDVPFPRDLKWPRVSVVVCTYNGARTLRDTLDALQRLDYPDFEVIVVNDGSTDAAPAIAAEYRVRLITTENRGLSSARNTGWQAADGEIVAYIDDDAYPDPHWLQYLAHAFMTGGWAAVGGPNIAPAGDGSIADCVANAPGGPVQVLISDTEAEHIPGCNMAFRRQALAAVGGFDPIFRAAGDDVDICWRVQADGGRIGFHPAALDWHHRRNSLAMYWRQQVGYGKAEALLERKWPRRYDAAGHLEWAGRLYGRGFAVPLPFRPARIYGGVWGSAAYQSIYEPAAPGLLAMTLMPEWYLVIAALAALSLLGLAWPPLQAALPLLLLAAAAPLAQAMLGAARATFPAAPRSPRERIQRYVLTAWLHLVQPLARLVGRMKEGLSPWRRRPDDWIFPWPLKCETWRESWRPIEQWLTDAEGRLRERVTWLKRGGEFDRWDLEVRRGTLGGARVLLGVEEHGGGRQMGRWQLWPRPWLPAVLAAAALALLSAGAASDDAWSAAIALGIAAGLLARRIAVDCGSALATFHAALRGREPSAIRLTPDRRRKPRAVDGRITAVTLRQSGWSGVPDRPAARRSDRGG
jgi:glycosyltransferase involved in cell wall biosynthesis